MLFVVDWICIAIAINEMKAVPDILWVLESQRKIILHFPWENLFQFIEAFNFYMILSPVFMMQSISEFLKNLPCHNEENFSLFNTENGIRTSSRRPSVYLPTKDIPSDQSKFFLQNFTYFWATTCAIHNCVLIFIYFFVRSYCDGEKEYFIAISTSAVGQKGSQIVLFSVYLWLLCKSIHYLVWHFLLGSS